MEHTPGENTERQRHHRPFEDMIKKEDRNDDRDVEKDRGECRRKEMSKGVQDPHTEGEEPHEKEIGEDNLVERNGQLKFLWNSGKSWGNKADQNR